MKHTVTLSKLGGVSKTLSCRVMGFNPLHCAEGKTICHTVFKRNSFGKDAYTLSASSIYDKLINTHFLVAPC